MPSTAKNTTQLTLLGRSEEANCYHGNDHGFFSLLHNSKRSKKQFSYRLTEMPEVLASVDPTIDTWMSQAEFCRPNRRVVNLARIGLLFSDLDYYRTEHLEGLSAERVADHLIHYCHDHSLPLPSLIVGSGQGLQAKWLLKNTIPRQALPRWNACQRQLVDKLTDFGSDPLAKDASRVLRLVNTVNSKNGQLCRVVHVTPGEDGEPVRYDFEWLCEMLLPVARWDIEKQQAQRKKRQLELVPDTSRTKGLKKFSSRQLAWDRLHDLRKLVELRGGVPEGERMSTLFWHLNFLLLSGATNHQLMWHEAAELARQIDSHWGYRSNELSTLYNKAKDYNQGKTVEFNGQHYPALYTPKNDTLINLFRITDDEQAQMKTIIAETEKKKRKAERNRKANDWKVSREEYTQQAEDRAVKAQQLRSTGLSMRAIAKELGVSVGSVHGYLKKECSKW